MTLSDESELRAIWQSQLIGAQPMTPEQLRSRAKQFESKARRGLRINQISAGLVATICAFGLFFMEGGLLFKVGAALLLMASVYIAWGMRFFFSALPVPTSASAGTCAAVHKRQLERQRDLNLSMPSGVRVMLPGTILVLLDPIWPITESHAGPAAWAAPAATIAIALFLFEVSIIYGKIIARRFQREINELEAMMKDAPR